MSTSGNNTRTLRAYTFLNMFEEAARRAGITQEQFTSEVTEIALDLVNLMFDEMLNLGIQLWGRDRIIIPIYENVNQCPAPLGTSLILSVNQRYLQRVIAGTPFSTEGGTASLAFDDDFDTACTQTAGDGSIGTTFTGEQQITTVGVLFGAAAQYSLFYEYTVDGSTWVTAESGTYDVEDRQWVWVDIEGTPNAIGWRVRNVGSTPLAIRELYFGFNPQEIPLGPWNLDDWNAMPVKTTPGVPWNYYQQRDIDTPVLYIWPMPNAQAKYYQFVCWRRRYLDTVSAMTQSLDLSRRWYEACTASLARRMCRSVPQADMKRYSFLQVEEAQAFQLAAGEERDNAPMRFNPGNDVYTV